MMRNCLFAPWTGVSFGGLLLTLRQIDYPIQDKSPFGALSRRYISGHAEVFFWAEWDGTVQITNEAGM